MASLVRMKLHVMLLGWMCLSLCESFQTIIQPRPGLRKAQPRHISRHFTTSSDVQSAKPSLDLSGYSMLCTFTGFGVVNMTCTIQLKKGFQAIFGGGIESYEPGAWRMVGYDDLREEIEIVHPLLPEHMYFFDLSSKSAIWKGVFDTQNKRIVDGTVTGKRKKLGIFESSETLATFTAQVFTPEEKLPRISVPKFRDQVFLVRTSQDPIVSTLYQF